MLVAPAVALAGCAEEPRPEYLLAMDDWIGELEAKFEALDAACSTDAPFALTYLRTQEEIRRWVERGAYDDNELVARWAVTFGSYYFAALAEDGSAPLAWQEARSWGAGNRSTIIEDLFMGVNAHINHDLALATIDAGIIEADGKADFDRIDEVFMAVIGNATQELADRYSPWLKPTILNDFGNPIILRTTVTPWRENAWEYALRLHAANDTDEFLAIRMEMDDEAVDRSKIFKVPKFETREDRLEFCRDRQAMEAA